MIFFVESSAISYCPVCGEPLSYRDSCVRINRICEKILMYASQQGKRLIDEHLVRYIIEHEMLGGDTHQ